MASESKVTEAAGEGDTVPLTRGPRTRTLRTAAAQESSHSVGSEGSRGTPGHAHASDAAPAAQSTRTEGVGVDTPVRPVRPVATASRKAVSKPQGSGASTAESTPASSPAHEGAARAAGKRPASKRRVVSQKGTAAAAGEGVSATAGGSDAAQRHDASVGAPTPSSAANPLAQQETPRHGGPMVGSVAVDAAGSGTGLVHSGSQPLPAGGATDMPPLASALQAYPRTVKPTWLALLDGSLLADGISMVRQSLRTVRGCGLRPLQRAWTWSEREALLSYLDRLRAEYALRTTLSSNKLSIVGPLLTVRVLGVAGSLHDAYVIKPFVRVHVVDAITGRYLRPAASAMVRPQAMTHIQTSTCMRDADVSEPWKVGHATQLAGCDASTTPATCACLPWCVPPPRMFAHDAYVSSCRTTSALNVDLSEDARLARGSASADAFVRSANASHLSLLWNEPLVFEVNVAEVLHPQVVLLFEILDDTPTLPAKLLADGRGAHQLAWAFWRPSASLFAPEDGTAHNLAHSAPLGFFPPDTPSREEVCPPQFVHAMPSPTPAASESTPAGGAATMSDADLSAAAMAQLRRDDSSPALDILPLALHTYQRISWCDRRVHAAHLKRVPAEWCGPSDATAPAMRAAGAQAGPPHVALAAAGTELGSEVPSPDAMLQYRMRQWQRIEAATLYVTVTGSFVPSVRYVQPDSASTAVYTYVQADGSLVQYHSNAVPPAVQRWAGQSHEYDAFSDVFRRPRFAHSLPTDILVHEPLTLPGQTVVRTAPLAEVAPQAQLAKPSAASRFSRAPHEACTLPDTFITSLPTGKLGCMALSFSPDGALLAIGCEQDLSHPIRLVDAFSLREVKLLQGHGGLIYSLAWSPDSKWLVSASADGTARVWHVPHSTVDAATGSVQVDNVANARLFSTALHTPLSYVYAAQFHPLAPHLIITGAFDGQVRLWDARIPITRSAEPSSAASTSVAAGGEHHVVNPVLVSPTASAAMGLTTSPHAQLGRTGFSDDAADHEGALPSLAAQCLGVIGSSQPGDAVHTAHVNVVECFVSANVSGGKLSALAAVRRLITADGAGGIIIRELPAAEHTDVSAYVMLRELRPSVLRGVPVVSVKVHPQGDMLLVLAHSHILRVFDMATYACLRTFPNARVDDSHIGAVFSPDGRFIAAGSEDGVLNLWEVDSGMHVQPRAQVAGGRRALIAYPGSTMVAVAWHPTQHLIATAAFGSQLPVMIVGALASGTPHYAGSGGLPPASAAASPTAAGTGSPFP